MTTQDITLASVSNAFTTDANNIALAVKPAFLPIASSAALGAIKIGANLSIAADGTLSANSTGNPAVWLTGNGDPADSLGVVGNYYQDISLAIGNKIWLKTQTTTSPFWVRQPNFESTIASYNPSFGIVFGFAYVATTANITLSGLQTIDGIALTAGNVVLVIAQTTSSENGLYVAASGAWTRSVTPVIEQGLAVQVTTGTANAGSSFVQTLPITTVGTSNQIWTLYSTAGVPTLLGTMTASPLLADRTIPVSVSPIILGGDLTNPISLTPSATGYAITAPTGIEIRSGQTNAAWVRSIGSPANLNLILQSKGTGSISIFNGLTGGVRIVPAAANDTQIITAVAGSSSLALSPAATGSVYIGNTIGGFSGIEITGGQSTTTRLIAIGAPNDCDLEINSKGAGKVVLTGPGGFYPLGILIPSMVSLQAKIAVATSSGALTTGFGTPGQVLTSNGTNGSPYWSSLAGAGQTILSFSETGSVSGQRTLSLIIQQNTLGLSVISGDYVIRGIVRGAFYQIAIYTAITQTGGVATTFNSYFSISSTNSALTNVAYGSGVGISVIKPNTTISNNDYVSATNIGFFSGNTVAILYAFGFITSAVSSNYSGYIYITRLS